MANNIRTSYTDYKAATNNPVDIQTYVGICNGFMKYLSQTLFVKGEVNIPNRLGVISISGKKSKVVVEGNTIKGLAPNWAETKRLWESSPEAKEAKQLVYHFNEETNGIRYKFNWGKSKVLAPNKTLYNLVLTRTNKRILATLIKQGKEYIIKS